jgi:hypothetical protein
VPHTAVLRRRQLQRNVLRLGNDTVVVAGGALFFCSLSFAGVISRKCHGLRPGGSVRAWRVDNSAAVVGHWWSRAGRPIGETAAYSCRGAYRVTVHVAQISIQLIMPSGSAMHFKCQIHQRRSGAVPLLARGRLKQHTRRPRHQLPF